jgi:hypothetical protein
MPLAAPFHREWRRFAGLAVVLALTFAAYFGLVSALSFSPGTDQSRQGMHGAIFLLDLLMAGFFAWHWRTLGAALRRPDDLRGWLRRLCVVIAVGSAGAAAALHADYVLARLRGAEDGRVGSLVALKNYLLAAQLSSLFFLRLAKTLQAPATPVLALFKPRLVELLCLSIALIPLVNYLAHNLEIFSPLTAAGYLGFFLLVPLVALVFLLFFERSLHAFQVTAAVVASLAFVHYSMPLVSSMLKRPVEFLFPAHVALALIVPAVVGGLFLAGHGLTARILVIATLCSAAGSVIQAQLGGAESEIPVSTAPDRPAEEPSVLTAMLSSPVARKPDVYLLVYDGLAAESMLRAYGIDNNPIGWLKDNAFKVYEGAYSVFLSSKPSMASLMDMRAAPRVGIGAANTAMAFFRQQEYQTNLILNAYLLDGSNPIAADNVFPPATPQSKLSVLYRGLGGGEFKSRLVFEDHDRDEWLAAKRSVLRAPTGAPRMLYAHSGVPGHSQNSGTCLPDETAQYAARLAVAEREMKEDIAAIASSQREAIIIVAGDHGPYLTGDCLYMAGYNPDDFSAAHLADRYGATLAIRWPTEVRKGIDDIRVIQDVFFAVTSYLRDDDQVWTQRVPAVTAGYGGIPGGGVKDGIIAIGKDKGRPLFER